MDPTARENPPNHQLVQHFEKGYSRLRPTVAEAAQKAGKKPRVNAAATAALGCMGRMAKRLAMLGACIGIASRTNLSSSLPYVLLTLTHILDKAARSYLEWMSEFWHGSEMKKSDDDVNPDDLEASSSTASTVEYLFVDFNAWLFTSGTGELWAGLVRNMFQVVEMRMSTKRHDSSRDFMREWRVKTAVRELENKYGRSALRRLAVTFVLLVLLLITFVVSEITGTTKLLLKVTSSFSAASGLVVALLSIVAAAVGPAGMVLNAVRESNTSRGDVVFERASAGVKNQLGFMDYVKKELEELFRYLVAFEAATGTKLVLVCFIDDLDRCLGGKNVKVRASFI